ncbi:MAG: hypothetical protein MPJ24_06155 [Pirellulaceae bacterium]|nr:hypothetical protein [Pirellulaceae bacterium]
MFPLSSYTRLFSLFLLVGLLPMTVGCASRYGCVDGSCAPFGRNLASCDSCRSLDSGCTSCRSGHSHSTVATADYEVCSEGSCPEGRTPLKYLFRQLACGSGCGEVYTGEWLYDPPKDDPCDQCGNWIGSGGCGYCNYSVLKKIRTNGLPSLIGTQDRNHIPHASHTSYHNGILYEDAVIETAGQGIPVLIEENK